MQVHEIYVMIGTNVYFRCSLLEDISAFVRKEASYKFLKLLITKDRRIARIEGYYRRIEISIESFQASYNRFQADPLINMSRNDRYQRY
jgi:hypothetical protein